MIVKKVKMDDHNLLMLVTSLLGVLGIKEIWAIFKQKIDIKDFKDRLSITECHISGMCQACQDIIFEKGKRQIW